MIRRENRMRIGGDIKKTYQNPEEWIKLVKEYRYSAVTTPIGHDSSMEELHAYMEMACSNPNQ
jgi:hypothetical protein